MIRLSLFRLRSVFIIFFFSLAIPSAVLSWKAHQQLRWEKIHNFQLEAQALNRQIDLSMRKIVDAEEARSDTDYSFLVLTGDPEARFVQRSELSGYPVKSDLPGVVGYFQIDDKGSFSSPLLPQNRTQSSLYGIGAEDRLLRSQLEHSIRGILSQNQLVSQIIEPSSVKKESFSKLQSLESQNKISESLNQTRKDNEVRKKTEELIKSNQRKNKMRAKKKAMKKRSIRKESNYGLSESINHNIKNDIQEKNNVMSLSEGTSDKLLGNKNTLNLDQISNQSIQINLFESKVEPFRFGLLKSGHFILYRQVWRNNNRVVQGVLMSMREFFNQGIRESFENSSVFKVARLSVSYADSILASFSNDVYGGEVSLSLLEDSLLTSHFSEPLGRLSLVYQLNELPGGSGEEFIILLVISISIVIVVGTLLLYRLSFRQLLLAQQQQNFVSSVSHELKTPLTSIRMYSEILKQGWITEEKKLEYYDFIYSESERLSRLINNVLQISKVNRNALTLELKPVLISELVSLVRSRVDSQLSQSQFEFVVRVEREVESSVINIDIDAMLQILINLIDNSIKYSANADNKKIDLKICCSQARLIEVSVRDYGPGIKKDKVRHIFELFYRSGDELTRETTGTGIGLALVKELALAMKASVHVVNHKTGVEFVLRFMPVEH